MKRKKKKKIKPFEKKRRRNNSENVILYLQLSLDIIPGRRKTLQCYIENNLNRRIESFLDRAALVGWIAYDKIETQQNYLNRKGT